MDLVKLYIEHMLYPFMTIKKGNKTRKYIQELRKTQSLSKDALLHIQEDKLRALLLDCIENVPAYQGYQSLKDQMISDPIPTLSKFPVLTKSRFNEASETYVNTTVSKSNLIANATGGSTNAPVKFYIDRVTVEHYEAARWRGLSWWDVTPGSRSVMIWGNPEDLNLDQQSKHAFKERWLKNRIVIPAYSLNEALMSTYIKEIDSYSPEYIYGYASALYSFAAMMIDKGLRLNLELKCIVSTSEMLYDFQRETISRAFNCPVVNEYGARDGGIIAYECQDGSMHISAENAIIEVVDPKTFEPVNKGEYGLILVTDLNNHAMPRLRYQLGDRVALSDTDCSCELGLPVIKEIEGREADMFLTVDGILVHGHAFNRIARSFSHVIERFQIIQNSPDHAELKIIRKADYTEEEHTLFMTAIQNLLPKTQIKIEYVADIPPSKSGKYRYSIRNFKL